ncbi:MAG: hypothetical protein WDN27_04325 [Candidatus Saccharibacteria bacterium]
MKRGKLLLGALGAALALTAAGQAAAAPAPAPSVPGDFNLQVSPSPLVTTIKPGQKSVSQLKIHNAGTGTEELQIAARSFTFNSDTGKVSLSDNTPPPIASWITFSATKFTVPSDQTYTEDITLNVPADAGFSYSFALVINRQNNPKPAGGTREINGSIAVFSLINVDRPGATSDLKVVSFTSDKRLYEYLPATLSVRFSNVGNTIVQPSGNIFIQRSASSKTPLATLTVNKTQGYILPGTQRTVTAGWNDGFATYQAVAQPDGTTKNHLAINWSDLSHFRFGRYTAKLVAVYSDGQHDVPIEGTVTFWVIPWRAILVLIAVIAALWLLARWRGKRRTEKAVKRALAAQAAGTLESKKRKSAEKPS